MSGRRSYVLLAAGVAVSALLLYLCLRKVELGDVAAEIRAADPGLLGLALLVTGVNFALAAVRSRVLLSPLGVIPLWRLVKSVLLAFALNNVVPFRFGEFARVGYLAKFGELPASSCLAVIAVERLVDMFTLLGLLLIAIPAVAIDLPLASSSYLVAAVVAITAGVAIQVSRHPAGFVRSCTRLSGVFGASLQGVIARLADSFARGLAGLRSPRAVAQVVLVGALFWALTCVSIELWLRAFSLSLPWYASVVVAVFLSVGLAVPSTPGHVGTFHFFAMAALTTLGVAQSTATSVAVVAHFVAVVPFTVLAIPLLLGDWMALRRDRRGFGQAPG